MMVTVIKVLSVGLTVAADLFYLLSLFAAYKFFSEKRRNHRSDQPPVTIMIPLHGADSGAYRSYEQLCQQDYPRYQLIFGVREREDSSIPIVERVIREFPDQDIELVVCAKTIGENLKVSNLHNMLERARYEHLLIVDSDIRAGSDYLRRVIAELSGDRVGLVTCLYRASEAPGLAGKLEAIGMTAEFAPGVLTARLLEGVKFALGSTMATTRARLDAIGGFAALADYLADDFMLGNLIAEDGYEVRVSQYVVETAASHAGFMGMIRHQIRWARSTRISRPMGYLGLILTYGTALALLNAVLAHGSEFSLGLLGATLVIRLTMAWLVGVHWLKDRILRNYFWLVPVRDLLSFAIWCASWVGRKVEWRGRQFEVSHDGKMVEVRREEAYAAQID